MTLLLLTDERMLDHDPGPGHPERPDRLRAILRALEGRTLTAPQPVERSLLEYVHDPAYVDFIESLAGQPAKIAADTQLSAGSVAAAKLATGAAVDAVRGVMSGDAVRAFALGRPPGHHAERAEGMGFCLFNHMAVAAAHAIEDHGAKRVLIVDWDVHHGNGTQHIFEERADVLVFNAHQHPLYPGTGAINETGRGDGVGYTVNAPLPAGTDEATYVALFRELLVPIADAYEPQLVLVSAGFDAHVNDPLGGMRVTASGFATLCETVVEIAQRHAEGRLALVLEGGYDLDALAESVRACVDVLDGPVPDALSASGEVPEIVREICAFHTRIWPTVAPRKD